MFCAVNMNEKQNTIHIYIYIENSIADKLLERLFKKKNLYRCFRRKNSG